MITVNIFVDNIKVMILNLFNVNFSTAAVTDRRKRQENYANKDRMWIFVGNFDVNVTVHRDKFL